MYLYLVTNPKSTQAGIFCLPKKTIGFQLDLDKTTVANLLRRLDEDLQVIRYNHETQEVSVLESLSFSVVKGGKPVLDCIRRDLQNVKDVSLIQLTYERMLSHWTMSMREVDHQIKGLFEEELKLRRDSQSWLEHGGQNFAKDSEMVSHNDNDKNHDILKDNDNRLSNDHHNDTLNDHHNDTLNDSDTLNDNDNEESSLRVVSTNRETNRATNQTCLLAMDNLTEQDLFDFYEEHFEGLSPSNKADLYELILMSDIKMVIEALDRARIHRASYPIKYANAVVKGWFYSGIRSFTDLMATVSCPERALES